MVPWVAVMVRVGFILEGHTWLGGLNYYRSLISAIMQSPKSLIQPILFVATKTPEEVIGNFRGVEIIRTKCLDAGSFFGLFRRTVRKLFGQRDYVLEWVLLLHKIKILSHYSGELPRGTSIKAIGWIPDFQYIHLPDLFTKEDSILRKEAVDRVVRNSKVVILSSEAAQRDLAVVAPKSVANSRVLRFVPMVDLQDAQVGTARYVECKYDLVSPYFYLPNQFWVHKNHVIVINALAIMKSQGIKTTVVASGAISDHRFPEHYAALMAAVTQEGLSDAFIVLGVVPYADLISLIRGSLALINPSLFEGWSTTVEEAKALDKLVLLSDIPVHREQNPKKGIFFDPRNPEELAKIMRGVVTSRTQELDANYESSYSQSYEEDRIKFAQCYADVVAHALSTE